MENIIIPLAALIASVLSFYSGFGLGTLLMPALAVFFPLPAAIAATALVHGANNLLKLMLVGAKAEKDLVVEFGLPAIAAAFAGAWTLHFFTAVSGGLSHSYVLLGKIAVITPLKSLLAVLMMAFALFDLHPRLKGLKFDRRYLPLGGLLSGFFGGLSGLSNKGGRAAPSFRRHQRGDMFHGGFRAAADLRIYVLCLGRFRRKRGGPGFHGGTGHRRLGAGRAGGPHIPAQGHHRRRAGNNRGDARNYSRRARHGAYLTV